MIKGQRQYLEREGVWLTTVNVDIFRAGKFSRIKP